MGVNDDLRDAALRHQLGLLRVSNNTLRRILGLLNDAEEDLVDQLRGRIARLAERGFDTGAVTTRRLEELLTILRKQSRQISAALGRELRKELLDLADYEREFQVRMVKSTVPVATSFRTIGPELLEVIVVRQPMQGQLLSEWAEKVGADTTRRVRGAIRLGLIEGESGDQVIRRIRGTRAQGYRDGILEISRHDAEGIVRTASSHVTNAARDALYERNADVLRGLQWVSTLDARTTPECIVRDGKLYSLDHKPIGHSVPWGAGPGRLHFRCRSTSTPVLKSYRELGLDVDDAPAGTRASMDGQVPEAVNFLEWIDGAGKGVAGDVFGSTRLRLLREGKLSPRDLFSDRGRFWTIDELRRREAEAFTAAGLRVAA